MTGMMGTEESVASISEDDELKSVKVGREMLECVRNVALGLTPA